jgi:chromosome segregation ATPase
MNDDSDQELAAPAGATYESHSGGIDDLLHSLLTKAEGKLEETRQSEKTAIYNFEMLKTTLNDEMKYGALDMDHAKKDLAEATQTKGTAEGDLAVTTKALAEDEATLADLHHDCMTKANDFEVETTDRGEELKALATAKKIVVEATSGLSFLQMSEEVSFMQVSQTPSKGFAAVHFVRRLAQKQHSAVLSQLASRMASAVNYSDANGANPFGKIKDLIMGMIEKLESEAEADADKKGYCDKEMSETEAKKAEKEAEIEKLSTKIDEMSTSSKKLQEEVAVLQKELAELAKAQATMDEIRMKEKTDYGASKAELEQGIAGLQLALKVLREYYAKGDASASGDAGSGIISMLEVA